VLRLDEDAIIPIPDISWVFPFAGRILFNFVASDSGSDMTDGAGLINKAGLRLIYNRVEMDAWPTAIQVRVVGEFDSYFCESKANGSTGAKVTKNELSYNNLTDIFT
jgi:hypothetical protein